MEGKIMQCPECQFENREGAKFCNKCGYKFDLTCPECGQIDPPESKFCSECGCNLESVKEASNAISDTESLPHPPSSEKPTRNIAPSVGERKHVTVLFSDLTGYTAMSEKLDPEEVKEITSRIFGEVSKIVANYDGFIEKYAGDAVMAIFGVPQAHEDDPIRAIKTAREIHQLVDTISPEVEKKIGQSISMHSGINTGLVVTGEVDVERGTHGIAGDTINLASRLSNLANPGEILVDVDTCQQIEGQFACEYLEETAVKGKADPIQVHKVLSQREKPVTIRRLSGVRANLVGRKVEMVELADAVHNLHQGKGRIFSISGDAGTGKSRLVEEFKATLDLKKIQWLEGHAYAYTQNIPYFLMIDLLDRVFHIKEDDPVESVKKKIESEIEQLVDNHKEVIPYVGGLYSLSYPEVEEVSPEFWKSRLQEAIPKILTALAKRAPTIFFLEDLHWADPSSVELLRRACIEIRQPAIVLCVYRPIFNLFKSHQVSSIGRLYHEMQIEDLSRSESQEMVQSLLKTEKVPFELKRFIQEKMDGNPFYLEEAINSLIESNTLVRGNDHWRVIKHISEADISSTIQGVISARVDRLEQESKRILQEASVIGRAFYYEILKRTTAFKSSIDKNLRGLEHLDLIKTKSIQPDLEYIFKHALTQEVVYNGLLKKERREIHENIAIVMEQLFQDRLPEFYETLAFHFARGLSLNKAINYLMKSGKKSLARYSVEESHQYYKHSYELFESKTDKTKEEKELLIDLLIEWTYVFYYRGDFKGLTDILENNKRIAESLQDISRLGMFYAILGFAFEYRNKSKDSYKYLKKALKIGEETNNHRIIGYACTWSAWTSAQLGQIDDAIKYANRAQKISDLIKVDQYLYFKSLGGLGMAYYCKGFGKKCQKIGEILLNFGKNHSNTRCVVIGHYMDGHGYAAFGDHESAIESYKRALAHSIDPFYEQFPRFFLGLNYLSIGRINEAEEALKEVGSFSNKFGVEMFGSLVNGLLGVIQVAKGNMSSGLKKILNTRQVLDKAGRMYPLAAVEYILGELYFQLSGRSGPTSFYTIAKNLGFLAKNIPLARRNAEQHFNSAIKISKEIGAYRIMGDAYLGMGLVFKAKKRNEQAKEYLSLAIQTFEECEAEILSQRGKEILASL
jgi:class 3 adenylate cyclase/tetratricopeptide (TPR) repeat protein